MHLTEIEARVRRLDELALNLMNERDRWRKDLGPLLWHEREAYDKALTDAIAGLETARVALAKVLARIRNAGGPPPCPEAQSPT